MDIEQKLKLMKKYEMPGFVDKVCCCIQSMVLFDGSMSELNFSVANVSAIDQILDELCGYVWDMYKHYVLKLPYSKLAAEIGETSEDRIDFMWLQDMRRPLRRLKEQMDYFIQCALEDNYKLKPREAAVCKNLLETLVEIDEVRYHKVKELEVQRDCNGAQ